MGEPASTNVAYSQQTTSYPRESFGATSPPHTLFRSDIFGTGALPSFGGFNNSSRPSIDRTSAMPSLSASVSDPASFGIPDARPAPAIIIRRLSRNIGSESLNSMLIFAGDLIDTEFIRSPYPDDHGFATAVARFRSQSSALEAQQKLHGKPNTNKDGNMIVEVHSSSMASAFDRRNTVDGTASRGQTSSATSSNGSANGPQGRSRFGSTFHPNEKTSPPLPSAASNGEFPIPESSAHFQNLFSPQSPIINGYENGARVSGKSMINDDSVDDETGELLKDPIAYANAKGSQQQNHQQHHVRRSTNSQPQLPISRFGSLSLSTHNGNGHNGNVNSPPNGNYNGSRTMQTQVSPTSMNGTNGNYGANYTRPQYPPVNPADQNPPCNTLYVGNLPLDTSEDELKAVFSKQRGYKRLCFRTKQNGPMCFVEFEDVSFATKALNELYGHPLHNSVKGGIRLSFSKNPLGVRSGQANGLGPNTVMNPHAMAPGYNGVMAGTNFSSVSGPPPGLGSPPGMGNAQGYRGPTGMDGMFQNPFGLQGVDFANQLGSRNMSPTGFQPLSNGGTYGREHRAGFNDYTASR